jgi:hypothetical protein
MTLEEQLEKELLKRKRLYDKGLNDEKLNDKIRKIQKTLIDIK